MALRTTAGLLAGNWKTTKPSTFIGQTIPTISLQPSAPNPPHPLTRLLQALDVAEYV